LSKETNYRYTQTLQISSQISSVRIPFVLLYLKENIHRLEAGKLEQKKKVVFDRVKLFLDVLKRVRA
jgi:hypothetical protein